jgi:hypothetical protein
MSYNGLKWTDFQTFFGYFHVFQVVEDITTVYERLQYKQVGTPTLPTAIPLKSSSSTSSMLVFNL